MHLTLSHHLEQSPAVRNGRPCLAGTRVTVDDVVTLHRRLGHSLDEIAAAYDLPLASLHAALAYYFDHRAEIDQQIDQDDAYVAAAAQSSPSKLRAKLTALRG